MNSPTRRTLHRNIKYTFGQPKNELARVVPAQTDVFIPYSTLLQSLSNEEVSDLIGQRQHVFANYNQHEKYVDYNDRQHWSAAKQRCNNTIKYIPICEEIDYIVSSEGDMLVNNHEDVSCQVMDMESSRIGCEPSLEFSAEMALVDDEFGANRSTLENSDSSSEQYHPLQLSSQMLSSNTSGRNDDFVKPASAPIITNNMRTIYNVVLYGKDKNSIIVNDKYFKIKQYELAHFVPGRGQWPNDAVVDYYLELIARRSRTNTVRYKSVYVFRSIFYSLLATTKGLEKVKQTSIENIFQYNLLYFPVCENQHWRLVVVNVNENTVTCYNSLSGSKDKQIANSIIRYLRYEFKGLFPTRSMPQWTINMDLEDIPKQDNSDDCGIFILQFANYLSEGKLFDFNATHMEYLRYRMLYECISGRLLM